MKHVEICLDYEEMTWAANNRRWRRRWRESGLFGFTSWNGFASGGLGFVWVSRLHSVYVVMTDIHFIEQKNEVQGALEVKLSLFIISFVPPIINIWRIISFSAKECIGRLKIIRWQRKVKRRRSSSIHTGIRSWLVAMTVINTTLSVWSPKQIGRLAVCLTKLYCCCTTFHGTILPTCSCPTCSQNVNISYAFNQASTRLNGLVWLCYEIKLNVEFTQAIFLRLECNLTRERYSFCFTCMFVLLLLKCRLSWF